MARTALIISAPMRYVRTAKRNGDNVAPKSWLMVPGRLDPQIGKYRTDALATSWVAVQVAVTIAVILSMSGETFDVSDIW